MVKIKGKKKLSEAQEFEIMKLVLDKFLWLGAGIMAYGLYTIVNNFDNATRGFAYMIVATIILLLFMVLIVKEYEFIQK